MPDWNPADYIIVDLLPLARPIDDFKLDPNNAREHPIRNIQAVKDSLSKYKQRKPIVVNVTTGVIEAGNGTWEAAKALGWQQIAAVLVEDDPESATGYSIADNRAGDLSQFNYEKVKLLLAAMKDPTEIPGINISFLEFLDTLGGIDFEPPENGDESDEEGVLSGSVEEIIITVFKTTELEDIFNGVREYLDEREWKVIVEVK